MLFMRTILSLSLVTFALAIPVAQPQAVGDLGGVSLIGRDDAEILKDIQNMFNDVLGGSIALGHLDQGFFDFFTGNVVGIAQCALHEVDEFGFFDTDRINDVLQEAVGVINSNLGPGILAGRIAQSVVDNLINQFDNILGPALAGDDGA